MNAKIFTTPTCAKCVSLKKQLTIFADKITVECIDATIGEGAKIAQTLGICTVPTVYLSTNDGTHIGIAHDIDEIESLLFEKN